MSQHACFETSRNLIKTAAAAFCMAFACCNFAFAEAVTENEASEAVIGWASLKDALGQDFSGAEADGVLTYCDKLVQDGTNTFFKAVIE